MTTTSSPPSDGGWWNGLHHALLALLIVSRPLIFDGVPGNPAALAWYALVAVALLVLGAEFLAGARRSWTWSPAGLCAIAAVALLVPAGLRSPLAFAGLAELGQLLGHLAFAAYASQAIAGRERAAAAALLAGLGIEALYALGQQFWVLPGLEQEVRDGRFSGGFHPAMRGDVIERIHNGGVYGSFTLSNTLAAFLLLTVPLAAGVALSAGRKTARAAALLIAIVGAAALVYTWSKGAWAALIVAVAVVAARRAPGRWRLAIPGTVVCGILLVLAVPYLRERFSASAGVRLGYWRAAAILVGERPWSGHGLGGYGAEAPRVIAMGAEYSREVHNEVLEATVAGGVAAGAALAGLFAILMLRRARDPLPGEVAPPPAWVPFALAAGLVYLHVFGLLPAGGFPGCDSDLNLLFVLPFALLAAGIVAVLRQATVPAWAIELALAAALVHALQDFDLHSGGVLGTLVAVACLGGGGRPLAIGRAAALLPIAAAVALVAGLAASLPRSRALELATQLAGQVELLDDARGRDEPLQQAVRTLHQLLGKDEPGAAELAPKAVAGLRAEALDRAWAAAQAAPAPSDVGTGILSLSPPGRERLPRSAGMVAAFPHSALARSLLAEDLAVAGQWHEALVVAREMVRRAPWHLVYRQRLAVILERCAAVEADPALLDQARAERARIAELQPQVYFRDRIPGGDR